MFVAASVDGRMRQARDILAAEPGIADRSLLAATVVGDAAAVRRIVTADPAAAVAIDDERGWPPLLYACYSRWHQIEPGRAAGLAEVVRVLLASGASPNTNDGGRVRYRSALRGSVEVNNPEVTAALLDAGASPDPGQPIGEAVGHRDRRCLRLLLAHGARVAGTWAVGAAVYHDDPDALSLLLGALQMSGDSTADAATEVLPEGAANASLPVVDILLDAGADPNAIDEEGTAALRLAVRAGRSDTAARLRAAGAVDDSPDIDHFIGYGITPDEPADQPRGDADTRGAVGSGVMADLARHLEAAYRDADLGLLGSLLHPLVRWTGLCGNREQVLDWYRALLADGTVAMVQSVEVDRDAVVLGLAVARQADGARPAPPQQLFQVFTVEDGQIVSIHAYPDRRSAFERGS